MPSIQTTYPATMPVGVAGQPATMTGWDADTKICEVEAGIGFGLAVSQGAAVRGVVLGGAADFIGISIRDITLLTGQDGEYAEGQNMAVGVRGDYWVVTEDAVAIGDVVEFNATTGALGSDGGTEIAGARWMTAASAGGLAIVRLGNAAGGIVA